MARLINFESIPTFDLIKGQCEDQQTSSREMGIGQSQDQMVGWTI